MYSWSFDGSIAITITSLLIQDYTFKYKTQHVLKKMFLEKQRHLNDSD